MSVEAFPLVSCRVTLDLTLPQPLAADLPPEGEVLRLSEVASLAARASMNHAVVTRATAAENVVDFTAARRRKAGGR